MASPGHHAIHGALSRNCWAVVSMVPQLGRGGCTPRPRKDRMASAMMAPGMDTVAWTRRALPMFGRMWRGNTTQAPPPGAARAEGTRALDEILLAGGEDESAGEPDIGRGRADADGHRGIGERRPEDGDEADGEDEEGERKPRVGG